MTSRLLSRRGVLMGGAAVSALAVLGPSEAVGLSALAENEHAQVAIGELRGLSGVDAEVALDRVPNPVTGAAGAVTAQGQRTDVLEVGTRVVVVSDDRDGYLAGPLLFFGTAIVSPDGVSRSDGSPLVLTSRSTLSLGTVRDVRPLAGGDLASLAGRRGWAYWTSSRQSDRSFLIRLIAS